MARSVYNICIPSSTRYLEDARHFVETHAREAKLSEDAVEQFKIAVDEACINVIRHAYDGSDREIEVSIDLTEEGVQAVIRDWGASFDPHSVPDPDVSATLHERSPGGLGLFLMRNVMDSVDFQFEGERGNTLTMIRRLGDAEEMPSS